MSDIPYVTHATLRDFAAERVNVKRDDLTKYRDQVNNLRSKLEQHIAAHPDYGLVKMRNSGSIAKGTALKTINDMDVAVYVKAADAPAEESDLLRWLVDRLREAYPQKSDDIDVKHHCVTMHFHGTCLDVDVVPVIYEGEDDDIGYLITHGGARVRTSVTQHLKFVKTRKDEQPVDFAQTVRFLKWWVKDIKRREGDSFRFKSFMVELLCAHVADQGQSFANYVDAIESVLVYIVRSGLTEPITFADFDQPTTTPQAPIVMIDPVNPDNNVAATYTYSHRETIVKAAHDALDAIHEAQYATTKGRAYECWQTVLGPTFRP